METSEDYIMKCVDGSYCNTQTSPEQWSCCNGRGGRRNCPKNQPIMCAEKICADNTDYCCVINQEDWAELRICKGMLQNCKTH